MSSLLSTLPNRRKEQTAVLSLDLRLEDGMKTLLLLHLLIQLLDLKTPLVGFFMVMGNWENAASYYMFQTLNHGIQ